MFFEREVDNPIQMFEFIIAIFAAEYSKGLKHFLQSDDGLDNP
jgi:hypothetical protein